MNDARFPREQCGGEDWQRRIFRAADLDRSRKRMAAVNENFIHTSQTGNVSHLNNRFSKKCRGNFFPPEQKKATRSDRFRSPMPAFLPVEGAMVPVQSVRELIHHSGSCGKRRPPSRAKRHGKEGPGFGRSQTED